MSLGKHLGSLYHLGLLHTLWDRDKKFCWNVPVNCRSPHLNQFLRWVLRQRLMLLAETLARQNSMVL